MSGPNVMAPSTAAVLRLLRERPGGITPLDALDAVGSFRLGARIYDLKALGYDIETQMVTTRGGARVARYRLHESAQRTLFEEGAA